MKKQSINRAAARAKRRADERSKRRKRFATFISLLSNGMKTKAALQRVGWTWAGDVSWFASVPALVERIKSAQAWGAELRNLLLEDELFERAVVGVEEQIISYGKIVATKRKKSDRLLELLYKKIHPELFVNRIEIDETRTTKELAALLSGVTQKTK